MYLTVSCYNISSLKKYYSCDRNRLPPDLAKCWIKLSPDQETVDFLSESRRRSANVCLQLLYAVVHLVLCWFLSLTDINGFVHLVMLELSSGLSGVTLFISDGPWLEFSSGLSGVTLLYLTGPWDLHLHVHLHVDLHVHVHTCNTDNTGVYLSPFHAVCLEKQIPKPKCL